MRGADKILGVFLSELWRAVRPTQTQNSHLNYMVMHLARTSHSAQTACGLCFVVYTILYVPVPWYGTR